MATKGVNPFAKKDPKMAAKGGKPSSPMKPEAKGGKGKFPDFLKGGKGK